jgi:hypothetical protein
MCLNSDKDTSHVWLERAHLNDHLQVKLHLEVLGRELGWWCHDYPMTFPFGRCESDEGPMGGLLIIAVCFQ